MSEKKDKGKALEDDALKPVSGGVWGVVDLAHRAIQLGRDAPDATAPKAPDAAPVDGFDASKEPGLSPPSPTQPAAPSTFQLIRDIGGLVYGVSDKSALDGDFADKFSSRIEKAVNDISAMPSYYQIGDLSVDGRARREATMDALKQVDALVSGLRSTSIGNLVKLALTAALNPAGALKSMVSPLVHAAAQFAPARADPAEQARLEASATKSLVDLIMALPRAIPTKAELSVFAAQRGLDPSQNQSELARVFRSAKLASQAEALKQSLSELGLPPEFTTLVDHLIADPLEALHDAGNTLVAGVGPTVNDPYNRVLLGHLFSFGAEIAPLLAPSKESAIAPASKDLQGLFARIGERLPNFRDALARLNSPEALLISQDKVKSVQRVLPMLGAMLQRVELGGGSKEPLFDRIASLEARQNTSQSRDFDAGLKSHLKKNKLANFVHNLWSRLQGTPNAVNEARALSASLKGGQLSDSDFYNALSRLSERAPSFLKPYLENARSKALKAVNDHAQLIQTLGQNESVQSERRSATTSAANLIRALNTPSSSDEVNAWQKREAARIQLELPGRLNDAQHTVDVRERLARFEALRAEYEARAQTLAEHRAAFESRPSDDNVDEKAALAEFLRVPAKERAPSLREAALAAVPADEGGRSVATLMNERSRLLERLESNELWAHQAVDGSLWDFVPFASAYTPAVQAEIRNALDRVVSRYRAMAPPVDPKALEAQVRLLERLELRMRLLDGNSLEDARYLLGLFEEAPVPESKKGE